MCTDSYRFSQLHRLLEHLSDAKVAQPQLARASHKDIREFQVAVQELQVRSVNRFMWEWEDKKMQASAWQI